METNDKGVIFWFGNGRVWSSSTQDAPHPTSPSLHYISLAFLTQVNAIEPHPQITMA